ncbi:MAG TPA: TetR/AcrR family transcriptional regulator [Nitrospiria bacterium]|nr:TetR/AcrR family transcriptional regulator [Nitrospiria bacterium]
MRTPQIPSHAREKLLDAAQRLMLVKGYPATTIDEICSAAKLTKGSFFHYFESKEDLGKALLDRYASAGQRMEWSALRMNNRDPLERVYGYLDFSARLYQRPHGRNGCLLGNFAQELSDTHPEIRSLCAKRFDEWAAMFKRALDEAKIKHRPRATLDTQGLAEHFIAVLEGSLILGKAHRDMGIVRKNLRHFKQYLKMVFQD